MKRSLAAVLLLGVLVGSALAQDELIPPKRSSAAKVGALGGYTTGWLFLDAGPINSFLTGGGAAELSTGGVFLQGGSGAAYIMVVKNLRVGGIGMSGHSSSSVLDPATGITRSAKLTAGFGGVSIEYVVPIVPRFDLVGGIMLGTGGIDLELRKETGAAVSWTGEQNTLKDNTLTTTGSTLRTLQSKFFVYVPSINFEYAFLGWVGIRVGASYVGMSSPSWKLNDNYSLSNVPSEVSGKGVMLNAALLIGTF
jgi:hypothetical protein